MPNKLGEVAGAIVRAIKRNCSSRRVLGLDLIMPQASLVSLPAILRSRG